VERAIKYVETLIKAGYTAEGSCLKFDYTGKYFRVGLWFSNEYDENWEEIVLPGYRKSFKDVDLDVAIDKLIADCVAKTGIPEGE